MAPKRVRQPTILLADDDEAVRELAAEILLREGYRVIEASDGADALRIAREYQGPIHLLLTDVIMPNIDGLKLAEQLVVERPGVKILYISGYVESLLIGCTSPNVVILRKPFTPEALVRRIQELLPAHAPDEKPLS